MYINIPAGINTMVGIYKTQPCQRVLGLLGLLANYNHLARNVSISYENNEHKLS